MGDPIQSLLACKLVDIRTSQGQESFDKEARTLMMVQGERNLAQFVDKHHDKGKNKGYLFTR